jgi:hypothetical protein
MLTLPSCCAIMQSWQSCSDRKMSCKLFKDNLALCTRALCACLVRPCARRRRPVSIFAIGSCGLLRTCSASTCAVWRASRVIQAPTAHNTRQTVSINCKHALLSFWMLTRGLVTARHARPNAAATLLRLFAGVSLGVTWVTMVAAAGSTL